jgi:hypothetical protein
MKLNNIDIPNYFANAFENLVNLETLNISTGEASSNDKNASHDLTSSCSAIVLFTHLSKSISQLPMLKTLNINELTAVSYNEIACLFENLSDSRNLKFLALSTKQKRSSEGFERFLEALKSLNQVEDLDFSKFKINQEETEKIIQAISHMKNLIGFKVPKTGISLPALGNNLSEFKNNHSNLKSFGFEIPGECITSEVKTFTEQLSTLVQLTKLEVSNEFFITEANRKYIFEAIRKMSNLNILVLKYTFLQTENLSYIIEILKDLPNLTSIEICDGKYIPKIIEEFSKAFPNLQIIINNHL